VEGQYGGQASKQQHRVKKKRAARLHWFPCPAQVVVSHRTEQARRPWHRPSHAPLPLSSSSSGKRF